MKPNDDGSAVVEFVLVSILVVALILALVQLGVALYIRNSLVAAAAEGARYAAAENRDPAQGAEYTDTLIERTLPSSLDRTVVAGYEDVNGVSTVVVEVQADLPVFGWLGPSNSLVVRGHAMEES